MFLESIFFHYTVDTIIIKIVICIPFLAGSTTTTTTTIIPLREKQSTVGKKKYISN